MLNIVALNAGYGKQWLETLAEKFEAEHEGYTVNLDNAIYEAGSLINSHINSRNNIDDLYICVGNDWKTYAAAGKLAKLDDFLDEAVDGTTVKNKIADEFANSVYYPDLDGTLLNDELTVSERNLLAIEKFRAAGGIFTIATGRMPSSVKRYAEMLGLDAHPVKMICNIGGIIVDSATMETERLASVSPQSASALLRYALPRVEFGLMYYASGAIASEMSEAVENLLFRYRVDAAVG